MALIKCPECGKEVSDQAEVCIHCGYPLKKNMEEQETATHTDEATAEVVGQQNSGGEGPQETAEKKKGVRNAVIAVIVVVGIIIAVVAITEYRNHAYTRAQKNVQQYYNSYQTEKEKLDSLENEKAAVDAAIDALNK